VEGFGVEKPYYSPFISKKNEDAGWFPDNVDFESFLHTGGGGDTVAVILNERRWLIFAKRSVRPRGRSRDSFAFPGCPEASAPNGPRHSGHARRLRQTTSEREPSIRRRPKRKGRRRSAGGWSSSRTSIPWTTRSGAARSRFLQVPFRGCPRPSESEISLKDHQNEGVAWLQHLWSMSPDECRGAVLADDMGLGKTIQLLAFMAKVLEENPQAEPFLIVAPRVTPRKLEGGDRKVLR
jgi:hypothetical protein